MGVGGLFFGHFGNLVWSGLVYLRSQLVLYCLCLFRTLKTLRTGWIGWAEYISQTIGTIRALLAVLNKNDNSVDMKDDDDDDLLRMATACGATIIHFLWPNKLFASIRMEMLISIHMILIHDDDDGDGDGDDDDDYNQWHFSLQGKMIKGQFLEDAHIWYFYLFHFKISKLNYSIPSLFRIFFF